MTTIPFPAKKSSQLAFCQWVSAVPGDTLERLRVINLSTTSSRHVILSLTYALYDPHIRKLNRIITSLLIARLKAERTGKARLVLRINNLMDDVHAAIDEATGTASLKRVRGSPCNRSPKANLAR